MDKQDVVHMHNTILAVKMKDILLFMTTCIDLEGIMLSEINQTKKDNYCMISFICGI